ncbi:MAG TPA: TauD/TfdA family dioxygenase [Streptosporangiaceae bacterium]|nr:TauD/TfdA family dioxygenase [Streptosporangiaceae bacterium]
MTLTISFDTCPAPALAAGQESESLADWIAENPGWESPFYQYGYMLFRGFRITSLSAFETAIQAIMRPSLEFAEETSPRSQLSDHAYTSTDYPPSYPIQFHHEFSYRRSYPARLAFCCLRPAHSGGATPLADSRKVLRRLPADVVARFDRLGVRYVRNFGEMGVSWQDSFGETSKEKVSGYCRDNGIAHTWSGDYLHTCQEAPATIEHPVTGERTWFNSVMNLNVCGIEPEPVREALRLLPEDSLPTNTYYGSGEPVEPAVIELLRQAYAEEAVRLEWQCGDLLLIDNVLTAHARDPFEGPRKVITAMGYAR